MIGEVNLIICLKNRTNLENLCFSPKVLSRFLKNICLSSKCRSYEKTSRKWLYPIKRLGEFGQLYWRSDILKRRKNFENLFFFSERTRPECPENANLTSRKCEIASKTQATFKPNIHSLVLFCASWHFERLFSTKMHPTESWGRFWRIDLETWNLAIWVAWVCFKKVTQTALTSKVLYRNRWKSSCTLLANKVSENRKKSRVPPWHQKWKNINVPKI